MNGSQGRSEYKTSQRLQPHERHAAPQGRGSGITAVDSVKGRESTEPIEDRADGYFHWFAPGFTAPGFTAPGCTWMPGFALAAAMSVSIFLKNGVASSFCMFAGS